MVRTRITTWISLSRSLGHCQRSMGAKSMPMHNNPARWSLSPNLRSLLCIVSKKWAGQVLWDGMTEWQWRTKQMLNAFQVHTCKLAFSGGSKGHSVSACNTMPNSHPGTISLTGGLSLHTPSIKSVYIFVSTQRCVVKLGVELGRNGCYIAQHGQLRRPLLEYLLKEGDDLVYSFSRGSLSRWLHQTTKAFHLVS